MTWRTFDFTCDNCGKEIFDEIVDVSEEGCFEAVLCPVCSRKMCKKFPVSNFQFSKDFFRGMGPRRIEAQYVCEDGTTVTEDLTHKVKVDA